MALQPSIRVINGKVFGAYAAQAKNVAYGQGTVEDALDGLTANKQNNLSIYGTTTYSGTTTSGSTLMSLQLPAGKYMVLPAGYVSGYGAYIYKGTTGTGWSVNGTSTITLTETTTLNIGAASSSSTTWTNFCLRFLKIA